MCERPKRINYITAYLLIRPLSTSPSAAIISNAEHHFLRHHSITIGTQDGSSYLGNFDVVLLPASSSSVMPSARYRFFDLRSRLLIIHNTITVSLANENNPSVPLQQWKVTEGDFSFPPNLPLSAGYYLLTATSNCFDDFSQRLLIYMDAAAVVMNQDLPVHDVCLRRMQISPPESEVPLSESLLIDDPSSAVVDRGGPTVYEVGTITSINIDADRLKSVGGSLQHVMSIDKSTNINLLISQMEEGKGKGKGYILEVVAVPYLSGKCATIKIRITLSSSDEWFNKDNYGVVDFLVADQEGTVFDCIQLEVVPQMSCRPPVAFRYFDKWRESIVKSPLTVEVFLDDVMQHPDKEVLDGIVDLSTPLIDGVWSFNINQKKNNGFEKHHCKFVSYKNFRNSDSSVSFDLICLLSRSLIETSVLSQLAATKPCNMDYILPRIIESGSVVAFPLLLDDQGVLMTSDLSTIMKEKKYFPLPIEVIMGGGGPIGDQLLSAVAIAVRRDDLFDGLYINVKFAVTVSPGAELDHRKYGDMKVLIGCPNGSVFQRHSSQLLPNPFIASAPFQSYQLFDRSDRQPVARDVSITLSSISTQSCRRFCCKGPIVALPDDIECGFWKMEMSSRNFDIYRHDLLIYCSSY